MKWSAVSALLAAPVALAGSLHADLAARYMASEMTEGNDGYGSSYGSSGQSEVIVDVVLIWTCNGGGESTKTVNDMSTMGSSPIATHTVVVGGDAGLVYTPDTISANIGDMVIFEFMSENHTATQSAFTKPCEAISGFDSGFMSNPNNTVSPPPQMAMQVKVSTPLWFYCRQKGHCGKGMTFSINPTANKTQEMFMQMAIAQNGTGTTAAIVATNAPVATTSLVSAMAVTTSVATPASTGSSYSSGSNSGSVSQGSGSMNSAGECSCSCFCGVSNYPSNVQGLMGFGGMSGSMPMSAYNS